MGDKPLDLVNKCIGVKGKIIDIDFHEDGRRIKCLTPDDQLWGAIKDVLLLEEYEMFDDFKMNNFKNKVVVDAGAHVGLFSIKASVYAKEVISLEPHPLLYKLLETNVSHNNVMNQVKEVVNEYECNYINYRWNRWIDILESVPKNISKNSKVLDVGIGVHKRIHALMGKSPVSHGFKSEITYKKHFRACSAEELRYFLGKCGLQRDKIMMKNYVFLARLPYSLLTLLPSFKDSIVCVVKRKRGI